MNTLKFSRILILAAFTAAASTFAWSQDTTDPKTQESSRPIVNQVGNQQVDIRQNVLMQLGLSREQVQQIRLINRDRKPLMDEAQRRFREANVALDLAIYSDETSDADVEARLKDVQLAQAEVAKLRFANEYAVRKILTPEQLVRFRDLRQRFEAIRREMETRRPMNRSGEDRRPLQNNSQQERRFLKRNQQKQY
ncbi:MAG: hypothetical protein IPG67_15775 [Acidobacteria bacterium]|nr:hypothetical protein [Acidobacteriota bacterium]MBK7935454.1 hypothetical protein [Acidobacteriota bacterium]